MSKMRVLVGTRKGGFILTADGTRREWQIDGPYFGGWEVYHIKGSPADPDRLYASQTSSWFGQIIQRSDDGGKSWEPPGGGLGESNGGMPKAESNRSCVSMQVKWIFRMSPLMYCCPKRWHRARSLSISLGRLPAVSGIRRQILKGDCAVRHAQQRAWADWLCGCTRYFLGCPFQSSVPLYSYSRIASVATSFAFVRRLLGSLLSGSSS